MGNSGSIHHIASGLDELNSYYRHQSANEPHLHSVPADFTATHNPLRLPHHHQQLPPQQPAQPHVRVLPVLNTGPKLRTTMNGAILQSGGTISGRAQGLLQRSRTSINYDLSHRNSGPPVFQRSKTQHTIERNHNHVANRPQNLESPQTRFVSEPDLRVSDDEGHGQRLERDNPNKLTKSKIKQKKRKAPEAPMGTADVGVLVKTKAARDAHLAQVHDQRKLRLFKTRVESKPLQKSNGPAKTVLPPFRREKTFDSSQLARPKAPLAKQQSPVVMRRKPDARNVSQRQASTPPADCKRDFDGVMKRRSLAGEHVPRAAGTRASMPRQRQPDSHKKPPAPKEPGKSEGQSRIPQLTKTFYFGMEKHSAQPKVVEQKKPPPKKLSVESSESALSSEDTDGFYPLTSDLLPAEDIHAENTFDINVHVRPTLPRRQLEIPRFSPAAAWKMLTEEHKEFMQQMSDDVRPLEDRIQRHYREPNPLYPDNKSGDSGISGDAGPFRGNFINFEGMDDDGAEEMLQTKLDPILAPWTPQQDLDEDDSSSDGEVVKTGEVTNPNRGHVFSLSLPRESHVNVYSEKDKPSFSSLQKLKRTVSGAFSAGSSGKSVGQYQSGLPTSPLANRNIGGQIQQINYRSDNWLLSRSAPNSIDSQNTSADKENNNIDRPLTIQPVSLSYLTAGRHIIYLPNQPIGESSDFMEPVNTKTDKTSRAAKELESLQDTLPVLQNKTPNEEDASNNNKNNRNHRFAFQSTVRQIERRRLADKLSKEAEYREAQRKSELEAMSRVEEEFQRKRAREKASIRQQLRLYSLEEYNHQFASLPVDWQATQHRSDPEGAVSSASPSPISHEVLKVKAVPFFNNDDYDQPNAADADRKRSSAAYPKSSKIPVSSDGNSHEISLMADARARKKFSADGQEFYPSSGSYSQQSRSAYSSDSEFSMHFGRNAVSHNASLDQKQYQQAKCAELY